MKPLFGMDLTRDKSNRDFNGEELITTRLPREQEEILRHRKEEEEDSVRQSRLPLWLLLLEYLSGGFGWMILLIALVNGFPTAWKNAPWLLILGGALTLIWLILFLTDRVREKRVIQSGQIRERQATLNRAMESALSELGVPSDAVSADVMLFFYRSKKNPKKAIPLPRSCICLEVKLYTAGEFLCLSDFFQVYSIPKASMRAIRTVSERSCSVVWNKDKSPRDPSYRPYKLRISNVGGVSFKPYHILEFSYRGNVWGVYFPNYELSAFESVTGLCGEERPVP